MGRVCCHPMRQYTSSIQRLALDRSILHCGPAFLRSESRAPRASRSIHIMDSPPASFGLAHPSKFAWKISRGAEPTEPRANLLICNPPYVRHHHIDVHTKAGLRHRTERACGVKTNGLAGLYCYFMGLAHKWMASGGIAGWLIPSEFMSVNYGRMLKTYLLHKVTLLQIHRYDPNDVQFSDALVSSAVVWIKNEPPPRDHAVIFSYGGTLAAPDLVRQVSTSELACEVKWTCYPKAKKATARAQITLGDLFDIKRGLATGGNSFFIMDHEQISAHGLPIECFTPVLPSSRYIPQNEIKADENGWPLLSKQLFLLDTRLPEDEIAVRYPALKAYLDSGRTGDKPVAKRYLCRSRRPWYAQENRPPAPIVCTYMGRSKAGATPFRFILNHCRATACNVYLMLYPKPLLGLRRLAGTRRHSDGLEIPE